MAVESEDISIDSSVVNESPETKLFPIFTNQTPSSKHVIR